MRHLLLPLAAAAAMLTACSSGDGGNNSSESSSAGATQEPVPDNLSEDPRNQMVPVTLPSPEPIQAFPSEYQGRWGLVPADCEAGRADAKGLMVIAPTTLRFYESRAKVDVLRRASPGRLTADLSFSGEGQQWRRAESFTVLDDGRTLVRDEQDPAASLRYTRCPA